MRAHDRRQFPHDAARRSACAGRSVRVACGRSSSCAVVASHSGVAADVAARPCAHSAARFPSLPRAGSPATSSRRTPSTRRPTRGRRRRRTSPAACRARRTGRCLTAPTTPPSRRTWTPRSPRAAPPRQVAAGRKRASVRRVMRRWETSGWQLPPLAGNSRLTSTTHGVAPLDAAPKSPRNLEATA